MTPIPPLTGIPGLPRNVRAPLVLVAPLDQAPRDPRCTYDPLRLDPWLRMRAEGSSGRRIAAITGLSRQRVNALINRRLRDLAALYAEEAA